MLSTNKCIFKVTDKVKQTRVATHITPLLFFSYPGDDKLCITAHLKENIERFRNGFEMVSNNCSLVMLNHMALLSRIPSPGGVNQSCLLLVLMYRSLKATAQEPHPLPLSLITTPALKTSHCLPDGPTRRPSTNTITNQLSPSSTLERLL